MIKLIPFYGYGFTLIFLVIIVEQAKLQSFTDQAPIFLLFYLEVLFLYNTGAGEGESYSMTKENPMHPKSLLIVVENGVTSQKELPFKN